jgi:Putative zinc-finger
MNVIHCAEFEVFLADHIDGTLAPEQQEAFTRHMESCPACAAYAAEVSSAIAFMERTADVEPPPALMTKILHATNSGWELTLRGKGLRGWINRTFAPVLQPRFVLGAAFTLMSATMLTQCAGLPKRTLTAQDLDPVRIIASLENRAERVWYRTMKSYESMRLVYEVKSQLNEWSQQQREADEAAADASADSRKLPVSQPATKDSAPETTPSVTGNR